MNKPLDFSIATNLLHARALAVLTKEQIVQTTKDADTWLESHHADIRELGVKALESLLRLELHLFELERLIDHWTQQKAAS